MADNVVASNGEMNGEDHVDQDLDHAKNVSKKRSAAEASSAAKTPKAKKPRAKASSKATKKSTQKAASDVESSDNAAAIKEDPEATDATKDVFASSESAAPGTNSFTSIDPSVLTRTDPDKYVPATPSKKGKKGSGITDGTPSKLDGGVKGARPIPKSWDDASEYDRELYKMKQDGSPWAPICVRWKELTGEDKTSSALSTRYSRIQCNMMRLEPGHARLLFESVAHIERELESSKWAQVASHLSSTSGKSYQTPFLQKQFKELVAMGGLAALPEEEPELMEDDEAETNGLVKEEDVDGQAMVTE